MAPHLRLRLLAVAVVCAFPCLAPAQTVRLSGPPPRVSHVPITGGIAPELADRFLDDKVKDAQAAAELDRLLKRLANDPPRGLVSPDQQETLRRAIQSAGGQPEKALENPEVRKIVKEAAAKVKDEDGRPIDPEKLKHLEKLLADRYTPPAPPPDTGPDGTNPVVNPDDPPGTSGTTKPGDTGKAGEPPAQTVPPPPVAPPSEAPPPAPPEDAAAKERMRDFAGALADSPLAESPAFRRMLANLGRTKPPEALDSIDWSKQGDRFERRFADVGSRLPDITWPKIKWSARDDRPAGRGPAALPEAGGAGRAALLLLALATAGLIAWGLLRRQGGPLRRRAAAGWRLGPWPVRPEAVHTRDELVRAFEYLALLLLGPAARSRNHRDIAAGLAERGGPRRAAERLAGLYEQARYAPPDEALPDADLAAARAALSLLAGAAAA